MKIARWFYALALLSLPASYAVKSLLGMEDALWINPSLLFSLAAFLFLAPNWSEFLDREFLPITTFVFLLALTTIPTMISGIALRQPAFLYYALREPLRLWLLLVWLLTSCWFFKHERETVLRYTVIATVLALLSGFWMLGIAFGWIPAGEMTTAYARLYLIRQDIWVNGLPVPRMGGLFVEAPPFGLFMYSSFAVLVCGGIAKNSFRRLRMGIGCALAGVLFSLSDQVMLGAAIGLVCSILFTEKKKAWYFRPVLFLALAIPLLLIARSAAIKNQQYTGAPSATTINGNSVGERSFHTHYGLQLLTADDRILLFGIGPGRYGEYAADTGYFPETVTMQFSLMEILCEWGVLGSLFLLGPILLFFVHLFRQNALVALGLFTGLLLANGFQASWKWEGPFLAIATLYVLSPSRQKEEAAERVSHVAALP